MPKLLSRLFSKKSRKWTLAVLALLVAGFFGYRHWKAKQSALPEGIASGNGRLESKEVDVAAKLPLRVKQVLVAEGDLVKRGQVLVRLDTVTLEAQLAEARAKVASAQEQIAVARAAIVKRKSEIELAGIEKERSRRLVAERAGSQREFDVRTMTVKTTTAGLAEDKARLEVASRDVVAAQAAVAEIQSRIADATLVSPILGRVLYRLAEPGEVLTTGGKALTLVDLEDVYMEIFLPSEQAAAIKIGADARMTVDYAPGRAAQGSVSFVSPEAQFTPKEVETRSEREKLMFRVKIQLPRALVLSHLDRVKTGVRGVGYVKVKGDAVWPEWLQRDLLGPSGPEPRPGEQRRRPGEPGAASSRPSRPSGNTVRE